MTIANWTRDLPGDSPHPQYVPPNSVTTPVPDPTLRSSPDGLVTMQNGGLTSITFPVYDPMTRQQGADLIGIGHVLSFIGAALLVIIIAHVIIHQKDGR